MHVFSFGVNGLALTEYSHILAGRSEFIEVTRMEREEEEDEDEDRGLGRDREFSESPQPSPATLRHSRDEDQDTSQLMINTSTLSAPEVSLVPSPEVSKVGHLFSYIRLLFVNFHHRKWS